MSFPGDDVPSLQPTLEEIEAAREEGKREGRTAMIREVFDKWEHVSGQQFVDWLYEIAKELP